MRFLHQFLERVNRLWYTRAKVMSYGTVSKGTGVHSMITFKSGSVYFHSLPFSESLDDMQEVVIDNMTVQEMIDTWQAMGYTVTKRDEAIREGVFDLSALTSIETENRSIVNGAPMFVFRSNFWRVLYPIHRILYKVEADMDTAIEQLSLPSTRGEWVDYWASYFDIKRLPEETDELLVRRLFMSFTSVKSNDVAIEELVSFYIGAVVYVSDYAPNVFEVRVSPEFMDSSRKVRDIIQTLKGGGVTYILNYAIANSENYQNHFRSVNGKTFSDANKSFKGVHLQSPIFTEDYSIIPSMQDFEGFVVYQSELNQDKRLSVTDTRIGESLSMKMTLNGVIVEEM